MYLNSSPELSQPDIENRYAEKIADYSFDVIKFLVRLYVLSVSLYLVFFAGLIALETSTLFEGPINRNLKLIMALLTVLLAIYAWLTWYLVQRTSKRLRASLIKLAPAEEHPRLDRAQSTFVLVGTLACTGGTVILTAILIFIFRI